MWYKFSCHITGKSHKTRSACICLAVRRYMFHFVILTSDDSNGGLSSASATGACGGLYSIISSDLGLSTTGRSASGGFSLLW